MNDPRASREDPLFEWLDIRLSEDDASDHGGESPEPEELLQDAIRADRCLDLLQNVWPGDPLDCAEDGAQGLGSPSDPISPISSQGEAARPPDSANRPFSTFTDELGRFQVKRLIGYGGMGVVLLAHDPLMQRDVALKIPHGGMLVSPTSKARFMQEARVAGILRHPNIVRVLETGEVNGVCFIASEYWEGPTLAEWMEEQHGALLDPVAARSKSGGRRTEPERRVPLRQAVRICIALAEALQHAHDRGAVHRDLKPSNILLTEQQLTQREDESSPASSTNRALFAAAAEDSGGVRWEPRITDFGLALLRNSDMSLTDSGAALGTAEYMSPEQALGSKSEVGPAVDQYALGIIFYQLLTGVSPFRRESLPTTLIAVQQEPAPRLREFRTKLPRDLEAICLKAIAKEPSQRYAAAGEFADDLQRYLDHEPIVARPVPWWERVRRWTRRNPRLTLATSALVAAIFAVVIIVTRSNILLSEANQDLEDSLNLANRLQIEADASRRVAEAQARLAADREMTARRVAYLSDMKLAARAAAEERWIEVAALLERHRPVEESGFADVRNIEWYGLDRHVRERLKYSVSHPAAVNELAVFPDGDRVATACEDGKIRIWSLAEAASGQWQPEVVIPALQIGLHAIAVSPDGKLVAAAGPSWMPSFTALTLWDARTGQPKQALHRHATTIEAIDFSPNGRLVASASRNDCCRVWNFENSQSLQMDATKEWIRDLAFIDDSRIAALCEGKLLATLDAKTGAARKSSHPMRFSTFWRREQLVIGFHGDRLWFIDANSHRKLAVHRVGRDVRRVDVSEKGVIAVAMRDGNVQCYQAIRQDENITVELLADHFVHRGAVRDVAVLNDEEVVSGSVDGTLVVSKYVVKARSAPPNGVVDAVLFDHGRRMLSTDMRGRVVHHQFHREKDRSVTDKQELSQQVIAQNTTPCTCLAISHNEIYACAGFENGEILLFDLRNLERTPHRMNTLRHEMYFMPMVCAVGDDAVVYTSNDGLKVGVWDVTRQQRLKTLPLGSRCRDLVLTPDNRHLICGQDDIQVFRTDDYSLVKQFSGSNIVEALAVSPDGKQFVSAHEDGVCRIWDMATLEVASLLPATSDEAIDVQFTDDGGRILTCTADAIWIWDAQSTDSLGALERSTGLQSVSYSGGRLIKTGGQRGLASHCDWVPLGWSDDNPPTLIHPPVDDSPLQQEFASVVNPQRKCPSGSVALEFRDAEHVWLSGAGETRLWNIETGKTSEISSATAVQWIEPRHGWLSVSQREAAIYSAGSSQRLWTKSTTKPNLWHGGSINNDGNTVFLTDDEGRLSAFELTTGVQRWSIRRPEAGRVCIPWNKDMVVWGGWFPYVAIYDANDGRKMHDVFSVTHCGALGCNRDVLVSGHRDGVVRLWSIVDGQLRLRHALAGHESWVTSLDVSEHWLVSVSDQAAIVWDLNELTPKLRLLPGGGRRFSDAALSPDEKRLAIAQSGKESDVGILKLPGD